MAVSALVQLSLQSNKGWPVGSPKEKRKKRAFLPAHNTVSASTRHSAFNLAELPPELVEEVLVHAGVDACAALRHLPALRRVLAAYVRAGDYTNDCEKAMLKVLVDCCWSDGVQAMIDVDIRHPFSGIAELDWSGIVLPVSSIQKVYRWCFAASYRLDEPRELLSILTYNRINAGADCADLLPWGVQQVPAFVSELSSQYIKRGRNLDQLRTLHQELGVYLSERHLAKTLLPLAAQHGRLDLVQALDGIKPELLQEHSDVIRLAAENGHLQVVQYAYSRLLPALPQEVLEVAMRHRHEPVSRWLYEPSPQTISWGAALSLVRGGHIDLLQQLQSNRHIESVEPHYTDEMERRNRAGTEAVAAKDVRLLQVLKQLDPQFSTLNAVARNASRVFLPTLQHVIRNESPTPNSRVFCAAASAGRTDIVDWMLAECPQWTSAEIIKYAAGAGHQELAQRLSDHFAVPLKDCILQPRHLQALVDSGHLQKLKWIEKCCQLSCDERLLLSGIKSRNLAVAQLLHRHCQDVEFTAEMLTEACRTGNLRMVQWVYQHLSATVRPADAIDTAAKCGFEHIVTWLTHDADLPCTTNAMNSAARMGGLELVRFLHGNRTEGCTSDAMTNAVRAGHLDVADYLRLHRSEGCWRDTFQWAIYDGCTLASIQWVVRHYPEQLTEDALSWVAEYSRADIIEHLHMLPNAPFSAATMDSAAASGDLELVRWFHLNRKEGCTAYAMKRAAQSGYLSIVKFLHEHDYPMCKWRAIERSPEYIQEWWRSIEWTLLPKMCVLLLGVFRLVYVWHRLLCFKVDMRTRLKLALQRYFLVSSREIKHLDSGAKAPIYQHLGKSITGIVTTRYSSLFLCAYGYQAQNIDRLESQINIRATYANYSANRWLEGQGQCHRLAHYLLRCRDRCHYSQWSVGKGIAGSQRLCNLEANFVAVQRFQAHSIITSEAAEHDVVVQPSWPPSGDITFDNHTTAYQLLNDDTSIQPVLRNLNLKICGGEKIGMCGRTAAGKSTITLSLFHIIEAVTGSIEIDGQDISIVGLTDLRSRLTNIPQDPMLFQSTVCSNLDPLSKHSDEAVWKALVLVNLREYVAAQEGKLRAELLTLAAALLRKQRTVIFDEATSATDAESDAIVQHTIRSEFKDYSVLTIAHRIATIMNSDPILMLDQGQVTEFDTPQVLLQNPESAFAKLVESTKAH
ncbi:Multidrug resistance-associated protein 1 [Sorochytrium milnesiophthora]